MKRDRGHRIPRLAWVVLGLAGLLASIAALLAYALPSLIERALRDQGSGRLGRAVAVDRVETSLARLSVRLHGLTIAGRPGQADPAVQVERLQAELSPATLWRLAPVLKAIEIERPVLRAQRRADGGFDFDDALARLTAGPPAPGDAAPSSFRVGRLAIRGGELHFDDRAAGKRSVIDGLQLALQGLAGGRLDDAPAELTIAARIDGAPLQLQASGRPLAAARPLRGRLTLGAAAIAPWQGYVGPALPFSMAAGTLALQLNFDHRLEGGRPQLGADGRVTLADADVRGPGDAPLLRFRRIELPIESFAWPQQTLALGRITIDGLQADLTRAADGRLRLPIPQESASVPAPASAPRWRARLAGVDARGGALRWRDETVPGAPLLHASDIEADIGAAAWPLEAPVTLSLAFGLAGGDARLKLAGEASRDQARMDAEVDGLPLAAARPWLPPALTLAIDGRLRARSRLEWRRADGGGGDGDWRVDAGAAQIDGLRLAERGGAVPLQAESLALDGVTVDGRRRQVAVGQLRLQGPRGELLRDPGGAFNTERWFRPGRAAPAVAASSTAAWQLRIADARIEQGRFSFVDRALPQAAQAGRGDPLVVDVARLHWQGLHWPADAKASPARFTVEASLPAADSGAPPGRLAARGEVHLATFALKAGVEAERLPLHRAAPYLADRVPVTLARGELGLSGEFSARPHADGLQADARFKLLLADVRVNARRAEDAVAVGDELLGWQALQADALRLRLAAGARPRIDIGALALSDFYSRLVITEQGRFNLTEGLAQQASSAAAPTPATGPTPAAGEPASGPALPFDLVIEATTLANGRIDFNDRFVKPNYSAELTELAGRIGRLDSTSREMATIEMRGRAAGTAQLEIRGALNPTVVPLALDLGARATDLELAPLSPYAGKYAGYAIERGKLSMDVAYKIEPDGKLEAKNQIILNQLSFGERIESADATQLPVRLAVALLSDRHGVIDINLPVSGSINDPQFSVFGIVLKVIGNLLVKAVTAPFALLTGGSGPDLSQVEFVPGTARIAPAGAAVIEQVAKSLADRPQLRMTVTGTADAAAERQAWQAAALEERLQAEQRRELARAGTVLAPEAPLPAMDAAARERLLERLYADTAIPDKPRNALGLLRKLPPAQMASMLERAVVVSNDSARELALKRGLAVRDALAARGLAAERLFLGAPKARLAGEDEGAWTPRVQLSLEAR